MYDAVEVPPLELGVVPLRRTAVDCALDRVANRGLTPVGADNLVHVMRPGDIR